MKVFFIFISIYLALVSPLPSQASFAELTPCVEINHCVKEEWNVENINEPLNKTQKILSNTPRTELVEIKENYLHAEITSRIMKYVDDLEISYSPNTKRLIVRSESRVGDGDFGVNQKRVDLLKSELLK